MLSFKRLIDTEKEALRPNEKRKSPRFGLSDTFPFKTKLTLFQNGGVANAEGNGKDWSATLIDLSASGANIQLSLAAVAFQREVCRLKISRGEYLLEIPATIAHFRCGSQFSQCGLAFNFPNPEVQQAYQQLLDPIIIGNSLVPLAVEQDSPGQHKEQYGNGTSTSLGVWREAPAGRISGFEMRMHHYMVGWSEGETELEVSRINEVDPAGVALAVPEYVALTEAQHEDFRWLFCLAVPNLSESVPMDVRKFLWSLVG